VQAPSGGGGQLIQFVADGGELLASAEDCFHLRAPTKAEKRSLVEFVECDALAGGVLQSGEDDVAQQRKHPGLAGVAAAGLLGQGLRWSWQEFRY
jgi:hypothetical protein